MSEYQVTLLGIPGVFNNGRIVHFPYRKAEGIFYYLCVEKKVNRDELISVFWGSSDESSGRKNLRLSFRSGAAWIKTPSCCMGKILWN